MNTQPLPSSARVTLWIGSSILGLLMLAAPLTNAQSPSGISVINNDANVDARNPALAVDGQGNPVIAWVEVMNGSYQAFVKRWNGKAWSTLGGSLNIVKSYNAFEVALTIDRSNAPVVAWAERSTINEGKANGPGKVHVARWDGTTWKQFGESPIKSETRAADQPMVKLDSKGFPVLAWSELSPDFNADSFYVSRWTGSAWQTVDPGALSTDVSGASRSRDLAVTSQDVPLLAWSVQLYETGKGPLDFNVFVGPWQNNRWNPIGGGSLNLDPTHYGGSASIALDAKDRPVVAWKEANQGFDILVKRWTGTAWERIGETVNGKTGLAGNPKIALEKDGTPVVSWIENAGASNMFVARWNGTSWMRLGEKLNANPKAYAITSAMALDAKGLPIIVWSEEVTRTQLRVYAKRFDGKAWVSLER